MCWVDFWRQTQVSSGVVGDSCRWSGQRLDYVSLIQWKMQVYQFVWNAKIGICFPASNLFASTDPQFIQVFCKILKRPKKLYVFFNRKHHKMAQEKIPNQYLCPISHMIMIDPVIAEDGFTYEREEIEQSFRTSGNKSPMTRAAIPNKLIANHAMKSLIADFLEAKPADFCEENVYLPTRSLCEAIKKEEVTKITAPAREEQAAVDVCHAWQGSPQRVSFGVWSRKMARHEGGIGQDCFPQCCWRGCSVPASQQTQWAFSYSPAASPQARITSRSGSDVEAGSECAPIHQLHRFPRNVLFASFCCWGE